jgi:hypothetical protein
MSKSVYSTTAGFNINNRWIASVKIRNGNGGSPPTGFKWYNSSTNTYTNALGLKGAGTSTYNADLLYIYPSPGAPPPYFAKNELKIVNRRLTRVDNGDYLVYDMEADFSGNYTGERYIDVLETQTKRKGSAPQKSQKEIVTETLNSLEPQDLSDKTLLQTLINRYANSEEALLEIEKKFGVSIVYRG